MNEIITCQERTVWQNSYKPSREIEQKDDASGNIELPKDLEIRLIRLALKIMERDRNDN